MSHPAEKGGFWGTRCNELELKNPERALNLLKTIERGVPARGRAGGRTSDNTERWCIIHFLMCLIEGDCLALPCRVVKNESPDFQLVWETERMGLEITEAIRSEAAQADAILDQMAAGAQRAIAHPTEDPRTLVRRAGERATGGRGWIGKEAEGAWADEIAGAIVSKTAALNKPGFACKNQCDLIVYDNSEAKFGLGVATETRMRECLLPILRAKLPRNHKTQFTFRRICILKERLLFYDLLGTLRTFKTPA